MNICLTRPCNKIIHCKGVFLRYYGSRDQEQNLGGWFDPYECTYNLTSYLEQAYLTLFAKSKEATLFCLDAPAKVMLFTYDNDTAIIRSDLPYTEKVVITYKGSKGTRSWERNVASGINLIFDADGIRSGADDRFEQ